MHVDFNMSQKRSRDSDNNRRPKRSRKPTNYDSHLHWIEETQLHKALMKSLRDKNATNEENCSLSETNTDELHEKLKDKKMPRLSAEVTNISECDESKNSNSKSTGRKMTSKKETKNSKEERTVRVSTRIQAKIKELNANSEREYAEKMENYLCNHHAAMMQPSVVLRGFNEAALKSQNLSISNSKDCSTSTDTYILKTRAQRKFPCNAVLPYENQTSSSSQSPCDQCLIENDITVKESTKYTKIQNSLIKTDTFLNYLCFRNSPIEDRLFPNGLERQ